MKTNMGQLDRTLRIAAAAVIGILIGTGVLKGTWATVLLVLAAVFLLTGYLRFCPLYMPFGINTARKRAGRP